MTYLKYGIGLDVALKDVKACLSVIDDQQKTTIKASRSFANTESGFAALLVWIKSHCKLPLPRILVMEATGCYHEGIAFYLHSQGEKLSVVVPAKARRYMQALGLKSKNDKIDAQGLSRMACEQSMPLWQAPSEVVYKLRMHCRQHEALTQRISMVTNQLHALSHGMYRDKGMEKMLSKELAGLQKAKEALEKRIESLLRQDPTLWAKAEHMLSIKGMGILAVATVLGETLGFSLIESQAQLVSYAGYDVVENQSGQQRGRTRISRKGNPHLRRILHFPALIVVRYKVGPLYALFERVYGRTSIKMKAYVAVQKKLLLLCYTLWKKNEPFRENYSRAEVNTENTSGDREMAPSFSTAAQQAYLNA